MEPAKIPLLTRIGRNLGRLGRRAVSGLLPRVCPLCGRELADDESVLCLHCLASLPRIRRTRSDMQMVFLGAPDGHIRVISWFVYNHEHPSHRLIHDIKYHDRRFLGNGLGREFGREVMAHGDPDDDPIDIILPIPLHWTKHLRRGYNQAREIALGFADIVGAEVRSNLYARRSHRTQTLQSSVERNENVTGIFGIRHPRDLDGRHVAVLDDVITTGATITAAMHSILAVSSPASLTAISLGNTRLD